jgi:hypothetical protein
VSTVECSVCASRLGECRMTTPYDIGRARLGGSEVEVTELGFGGSCLGNLYQEVSDVDAQGAVDEA